MKKKTNALTLIAIILFLIVVVAKVCISMYIDTIIEDIRLLESIYGADVDVIDYLYKNYITLMQVETIGLTIALLTGCLMLSLTFNIKLQAGRNFNSIYKKVFTLLFTFANGGATVVALSTLFLENEIGYVILQVMFMLILVLMIIDALITYFKRGKNLMRTIKMTLTVSSLCALTVGVFFHCNNIYVNLENNTKMIELHRELATNYYEELIEDEEYREIMIQKYMFVYEEFHTNKGYIVGINNLTIEAYTYILKRDNIISLTTSLTEEQKEFYAEFTQETELNLPLLISLGLGFVLALVTMLEKDDKKSRKNELIEELLERLETAQKKVVNGMITQEEYNDLKEVLFDVH